METIEAGVPVTGGDGGSFDQGLERRRPGRPQQISPHLVALLRGDQPEPMPPRVMDAQRAVVGIGVAVLLSIPLWLMLGVIAWALLG